MTPEAWIAFGGLALTMIGGFVALIRNMDARDNALSERLIRLETAFEMMGRKAIRALHSPDDHLSLDKLVDEYINHNYDLPPDKWVRLHDQCERLLDDGSEHSNSEKSLLILGLGLSTHKMQAFGGIEAYKKASNSCVPPVS